MSDLILGLLSWLGVAVISGVLIGRFMRMPDPEELPHESSEHRGRRNTGLHMLPGYGWDDTPPPSAQSQDESASQ